MKLIQLKTASGRDILVEVQDGVNPSNAVRGLDTDRGVVQKVEETYESALEPLQDISNGVIDCIKHIAHAPEEIKVELSLKFSANAGVILTSMAAEANFKITLVWKNEKPGNPLPNPA